MPPIRPAARQAARPAARPAVQPAARRPVAAQPARTAARPAARAAQPAARPVARGNGRTTQAAYFEYADVPDEVIAAHATAQAGVFDTYTHSAHSVYKPREGENCVRIMPPTFDAAALKVDLHWAYKIALHYGVGPDDASYLCPNKMMGQPCVLCDERNALGDDPEALRALRPGGRYVAWIIDRNNEPAGPQLWSMPGQVEQDICLRSKVKRTGAILKISNPNEGYDITFNRVGTGINTKYPGLDISREPSPLSDDPKLGRKWLEHIAANPLDSVLNFYDQSYIAQVYSGQVERVDTLDPDADPAADTGEVIDDSLPAAGEPGELTPEEVYGMDEGGLAQVCEENGMAFDVADYDDPVHAALSVAQALFPDWQPPEDDPPFDPGTEPELVEPEPVQPAPRRPLARTVAARPVQPAARQPAARQPAGGMSPTEQAKRRLQAMRPTK